MNSLTLNNLLRECRLRHVEAPNDPGFDLSGLLSGFWQAAIWLVLFAGVVLGALVAWSVSQEPAPVLFDALPHWSLPSWTLPSEVCLRSVRPEEDHRTRG